MTNLESALQILKSEGQCKSTNPKEYVVCLNCPLVYLECMIGMESYTRILKAKQWLVSTYTNEELLEILL